MLRLPKVIMFIHHANNLHLAMNLSKICLCIQNNFLQHRIGFAVKYSSYLKSDEKEKRKKTPRVPKIMLIRSDSSVTYVKLEEAKRIAEKHNFELVEVSDYNSKSSLSVYKLLSLPDSVNDVDSNQDTKKCYDSTEEKATKLFTLKSRISEHDLKIKMNNINKVLRKGHKAKILLTHSEGRQENVLKYIATNIEGKLLREQVKENITTTTYSPLLENGVNNSE